MNKRDAKTARKRAAIYFISLARRSRSTTREDEPGFRQEVDRMKVGPKCGGGRRVIRKSLEGGD